MATLLAAVGMAELNPGMIGGLPDTAALITEGQAYDTGMEPHGGAAGGGHSKARGRPRKQSGVDGSTPQPGQGHAGVCVKGGVMASAWRFGVATPTHL